MTGFLNIDPLETPCQRRIFFNILSVFFIGRCAYDTQLAAGKRRFQNICGIQRTFRAAACTNQGMKFVNEQHNISMLLHRSDDTLHPFFKFAAVFRSRNQHGEIKRIDLRSKQHGRYISVRNPLSKPFRDGRLAYARFAEQQRVILGFLSKNLNHGIQFLLASNQRLKLMTHGCLCQIARIGFKRILFFLLLSVCVLRRNGILPDGLCLLLSDGFRRGRNVLCLNRAFNLANGVLQRSPHGLHASV